MSVSHDTMSSFGWRIISQTSTCSVPSPSTRQVFHIAGYVYTDLTIHTGLKRQPYTIVRRIHRTILSPSSLLTNIYFGFQNGLIEITPALSSLVEDPATATSTSVTPGPTSTSTVGASSHPTLPVFMDDASIVAGAKRGFPLSTYRCR